MRIFFSCSACLFVDEELEVTYKFVPWLVRRPYLLGLSGKFIINLSFDARHSDRMKNAPFCVCYTSPHFHQREWEKGRVTRG